jgi:muramoyltetrapeptide carboxypeptidase
MNKTLPPGHFKSPPLLKEGDTVAIASPAGAMRPEHLDLLDRGTAILKELGLKPRIDPEVYKRHLYMAGRASERAEHLMSLFLDPVVKGIFISRGGYGSCRILPLLDPEIIRKNMKVFLGFSDITYLHIYILQKARIVTFYGPHIASHQFARGVNTLTLESFRKVLLKGESMGDIPCKVLRKGYGKGPLVGGCLSNIVTTIGTPYQLKTEGCILFLEDVGEAPYRIDRMLTHMRSAGMLEGLKGIVFGEMVGCDIQNEGHGILWKTVEDALEGLNIPILYDLPSGHGNECITIPLGLEAVVDGENGKLIFIESLSKQWR